MQAEQWTPQNPDSSLWLQAEMKLGVSYGLTSSLARRNGSAKNEAFNKRFHE